VRVSSLSSLAGSWYCSKPIRDLLAVGNEVPPA
jgi:hypothetical protein